MAHFDMDDVYVVLSDEALVAADKMCGYLSIPTDTALFDSVVVECGRAFKLFLERDHEMGLNARQKLLRGMIERTPVGSARFERISQNFIEEIALKNPELFEVLQSLEKTKELHIKDLARTLYRNAPMDAQFLYGSWLDPSSSFLHLNGLKTAMHRLMYILECSFQEGLKDIYKVHKTSSKPTAEQQKKAVFETLHNKTPKEAQLFIEGIEHLKSTHPQLADTLLQRFYFMAMEQDDYNTVFDAAQVLTSEQVQTLEDMTRALNGFWEQYPVAQVFAQQWAKDVADRAVHIMDGVGRTEDLVVDVVVEGLDKEKIEERRAQTDQTLRARIPLKT